MDTSSSVLLGIIQGLTEFLPISSSGHLVLFQNLLGFKEPELLFDISLHVGTLVAVLLFFRHDLKAMALETKEFLLSLLSRETGFGKSREYPHASMLLWVLVGTIPTGFIGLTFKSPLEALFGSLHVVGFTLIVTGFIVLASKKLQAKDSSRPSVGLFAALAVGIAQGIAIIPGISRSGITIVCGLACNLPRDTAARFSFLLSIPATIGALGVQLRSEGLSSAAVPALASGFIVSAIVGLFALRILMGMVRKGHLYYFAPYCWAVGCLILFLSFLS
jgi:undecaprenyl-diphosphatase